jgi:hypothetical protein
MATLALTPNDNIGNAYQQSVAITQADRGFVNLAEATRGLKTEYTPFTQPSDIGIIDLIYPTGWHALYKSKDFERLRHVADGYNIPINDKQIKMQDNELKPDTAENRTTRILEIIEQSYTLSAYSWLFWGGIIVTILAIIAGFALSDKKVYGWYFIAVIGILLGILSINVYIQKRHGKVAREEFKNLVGSNAVGSTTLRILTKKADKLQEAYNDRKSNETIARSMSSNQRNPSLTSTFLSSFLR